jgi:hypothetical protein
LRQIDSYHAEARKAIADYISKAQTAKVNKDGVTSGAKSLPSNQTSRTPGSRQPAFSSPEKLKEHLEYVRQERKKAEEQLRLEAELAEEQKRLWDARANCKNL